MKLRGRHLLATLVFGLVLGWAAGNRRATSTDGKDAEAIASGVRDGKPRSRTSDRSGPVVFSRAEALREEIRRATPDKIPALMRRAIDIGDQAERMALMLQVFAAVDDSNVAAVMEAFVQSTRDTGRDHHREWMIAAYVSGQKAGETMMNAWMEKGLRDNYAGAHETFWGWCSTDPATAERWLEKLGDDHPQEKDRLMKALIGGMVINQPEEAIKRLATLEEPLRSSCTGDLFWHLVAGQGVDRAIDWMAEVKAGSRPDDEAYASGLLDEILKKACWAAGGRDGAAELAERLEKIHAAIPLDPDRLSRAVGGMRGVEALQLVENLSDSPVLADESTRSQLALLAVQRARQHDPAAAEKWLADHPEFLPGSDP